MSSVCGYTDNDPEGCGAPATTHFLFAPCDHQSLWTAALACDEHLEPARSQSVDEHPVGHVCPLHRGRWVQRRPRGASFCADPDEEEQLRTELHQPVLADA